MNSRSKLILCSCILSVGLVSCAQNSSPSPSSSAELLTSESAFSTIETFSSTENSEDVYSNSQESYTETSSESEPEDEEDTDSYDPIPDIDEKGKDNTEINYEVGQYLIDDNSNFNSKRHVLYTNINKKNVDVYSFVYKKDETTTNTTFSIGVLVSQAIEYKKAHKEKDVSIWISSFHFSIHASVNLNRESEDFGKMKNNFTSNTDGDYIRIAYLLILAARYGIKVEAIGQIKAAGVAAGVDEEGKEYKYADKTPENYYTNYYDYSCYNDFAKGKKVRDFFTYHKCYWTSYGDKAATDMMHTKLCLVSNYRDYLGVDHGKAMWSGSSNLDGITYKGYNSNNALQTATIIENHEDMYRCAENYLKIIRDNCGQEEVLNFREIVEKRNKEQITLYKNSEQDKIKKDEQILYLGTNNDNVFELYFTPFGGSKNVYDPLYNPYAKYINKLYKSTDYITFVWRDPKFSNSYDFVLTLQKALAKAFHNKNIKNAINVQLPNFDKSLYDDLKVGVDIGIKALNTKKYAVHSKDICMSYVENNERYYVTLANSINVHQGSMYYQSNFMVVIKDKAPNLTYNLFMNETSFGVIDY